MKDSESQNYVEAARSYACIAYSGTEKVAPIAVLLFCEIDINRVLIIAAIVNAQGFVYMLEDGSGAASDFQSVET